MDYFQSVLVFQGCYIPCFLCVSLSNSGSRVIVGFFLILYRPLLVVVLVKANIRLRFGSNSRVSFHKVVIRCVCTLLHFVMPGRAAAGSSPARGGDFRTFLPIKISINHITEFWPDKE